MSMPNDRSSQTDWDYIIVGARCAGATLATLLARQGAKVLLLDSAERGSNKVLSTHLIRPQGVAVLRRLGLSEQLQQSARPSPVFRLALDETEVFVDTGTEQASYCIRRQVVDRWLQDQAEAAGVCFLDRHKVTGLLWRDGRVVGVSVKSLGPAGAEQNGATNHYVTNHYARWVIGADGAHSTVAKQVNAETYLDYQETERAGFFAYFKEPKRWPHAWDGTLEYRGGEFFFVFRCDNDEMLLVYGGDQEAVHQWPRAERERLFLERLQHSPATAPLVHHNQPVSRLVGVANERFFFRKPYGPGYALVGDAGNYTHYSTGCGMTHALVGAEQLSQALMEGTDLALERFWRQRDVSALPYYLDAISQAQVANNNGFSRAMYRYFAETPGFDRKMAATLTGDLPINEVVTGRDLTKVCLRLLRQRDWSALRSFWQMGPEQMRQQRLIATAQRDLARVTARVAATPNAVPVVQ